MTKVTFLTQHFGEVSYTAKTPVAVLGTVAVDMTDTVECILSNDDWRGCTVAKYGTVEVELPEWLSPSEWLHNQTAWKWTWGTGVGKDAPESLQRFLAYGQLAMVQRLAVVKLMKTKTFRSAFRASLRKQLETWLETPADERQYSSPFSPKQWDALCDVHTSREAKRLDEYLYRSGR